jgi:MYXO-CTERM domain-containing protein
MFIVFASAAFACEAWAPLTALAPVSSPGLEESSGLAPSLKTPGQLWTHDDGGASELYRFGIDGTVSVHTVPDSDNQDWEDLASASCRGRSTCLYIGDIGGERDDPSELQVYVVAEPDGDDPTATLLELWELRWPGVTRDAEALLVHPCTLDAFIVTRGEPTEVFAIDSSRGPNPSELTPLGTLDIGPVTGGDFSPDGTGLVLRTLDEVYLFAVDPAAPAAAFTGTPRQIVDGLERGEAITWEEDGDLIVTSEGAPTAVGRLACEIPTELPTCTGPTCGCQISPTGPASWVLLVLAAVGWAAGRRPS